MNKLADIINSFSNEKKEELDNIMHRTLEETMTGDFNWQEIELVSKKAESRIKKMLENGNVEHLVALALCLKREKATSSKIILHVIKSYKDEIWFCKIGENQFFATIKIKRQKIQK